MEIHNYIEKFINYKDNLNYVNLDENNKYTGWVRDFGYNLPNGERMSLNLENEMDLFLLFVLVSAWSRTGPWENAVFLVGYLKYINCKSISDLLILDERFLNKSEIRLFVNQCSGLNARRQVSFRTDVYSSIKILYNKWDSIKRILLESENSKNYLKFIEFMCSIEGLGYGKNKMLIKVPLILREIRCQNIYKHIPGKFCCVVDNRVIISAFQLGIIIPRVVNVKSLLISSEIIYSIFNDLYDIPLFAYEDVMKTY